MMGVSECTNKLLSEFIHPLLLWVVTVYICLYSPCIRMPRLGWMCRICVIILGMHAYVVKLYFMLAEGITIGSSFMAQDIACRTHYYTLNDHYNQLCKCFWEWAYRLLCFSEQPKILSTSDGTCSWSLTYFVKKRCLHVCIKK